MPFSVPQCLCGSIWFDLHFEISFFAPFAVFCSKIESLLFPQNFITLVTFCWIRLCALSAKSFGPLVFWSLLLALPRWASVVQIIPPLIHKQRHWGNHLLPLLPLWVMVGRLSRRVPTSSTCVRDAKMLDSSAMVVIKTPISILEYAICVSDCITKTRLVEG